MSHFASLFSSVFSKNAEADLGTKCNSCLKFFLCTTQKMKLSIKDVRELGLFPLRISLKNLRIGSHLLKKSLMENFIFCSVWIVLSMKPMIIHQSIILKVPFKQAKFHKMYGKAYLGLHIYQKRLRNRCFPMNFEN